MKNLLIISFCLVSLPALATPAPFRTCFVPETNSVRYHTRDPRQLDVDTQIQTTFGDINHCPRQILFSTQDPTYGQETTIYQLGYADTANCNYSAVSSQERDQTLLCQK